MTCSSLADHFEPVARRHITCDRVAIHRGGREWRLRALCGDVLRQNAACGLGAVYGGATVAAWYPITPSTSVAEGYEKYAKKFRVDPQSVWARKEMALVHYYAGEHDQARKLLEQQWLQADKRVALTSIQ